MKKKLIWLLFLFPLLLNAETCALCHKKIHGKFIRTKQGDYCSKKCYHETMPKCENCRKPCLQRSVSMKGKNFCSKSCMHKVFKCSLCGTGLNNVITVKNSYGQEAWLCRKCTGNPSCYFCSMPTNRPALADGRVICRKCRSSSISDFNQILEIFHDLRRDLARDFGYDRTHPIELVVVDHKQLQNESKELYQAAGGRNLALMRYHKRSTVKRYPNGKSKTYTTHERCRIYVLHTVPRDMLIDALVHELTHDHIRHKVGKVLVLANEEGFCELAASIYNEKIGKKYLNLAKESNPDPVYGGGYRKMRDIYRRNRSLKKTMEYVK